jgi:hypothetical protein
MGRKELQESGFGLRWRSTWATVAAVTILARRGLIAVVQRFQTRQIIVILTSYET